MGFGLVAEGVSVGFEVISIAFKFLVFGVSISFGVVSAIFRLLVFALVDTGASVILALFLQSVCESLLQMLLEELWSAWQSVISRFVSPDL